MNTAVPEIQRMFFILYLLVGSIGLFGNFTIFNVFRKYRGQSALHIQLAVANMIMLTSLVLSGPSALYGKWLFGDNICKWFGFQVFYAGFATATFTCLICLESYLAVCHAKFYSKNSKTMSKYLPPAVWGYSFVFSMAPLLGWNRYKEDHHASSCGIDITSYKGYNYSYVMTTHTVFIVMALLAIYSIIMMYRKKVDKTQPYLPLLNNIELRRVSVISFVCLSAGCLPYYLRTIYFLGGYPPLFNSFLTVESSHWFIKLGSLMSCVAYLVSSVSFKRLVIKTTMRLNDEHTQK